MKIKQDNPSGELALKTIAMPAHTNANGDIFGGWIVSQMDIAACIIAKQVSNSRVTTVAIDSMSFHQPVKVGDTISCYGTIEKIGNTSITILIKTWIENNTGPIKHVTEGIFTIVAINDQGEPIPVQHTSD